MKSECLRNAWRRYLKINIVALVLTGTALFSNDLYAGIWKSFFDGKWFISTFPSSVDRGPNNSFIVRDTQVSIFDHEFFGDQMTIISGIPVSADRAVILIAVKPQANVGVPESAHTSDKSIASLILHQTSNGWQVSEKMNLITSERFTGPISRVEVRSVTAERRMISLISDDCWQGYCGSWLSIMEINSHTAVLRALRIPLKGSNAGAVEGCEQAIERFHSRSQAPRKSSQQKIKTIEQSECYQVDGEYLFSENGKELTIKFVILEPSEKVSKDRFMRTTARYRLERGAYQLVSGENAVPNMERQ